MLILNAADVRKALPMKETIEAMKKAFAALSDDKADVPLRSRITIPNHEGICLFMPAFVNNQDDPALVVKAVSVYNQNPARGLPLIHAAVLVFEADTGRSIALLEGTTLTAIRTGATGGAAIDLLARSESSVLAIFGAGAQARTQLEAACTVRNIIRIWIYDSDSARAQSMVSELKKKTNISEDIRIAKSPQEAVNEADIICTATTSTIPVFTDSEIKPGVHITAVGSYTPEMQEIPGKTVLRARVVVDSRKAALVESGDLIQPIKAGLFTEEHVYAEIGEIVLGRKTGRQTAQEITFFKSVGIAVQDAMAAQLALNHARQWGLGQEIDW
jgi:ornithine cyclodeaminase/alanine dehydrogenase-like protein (mu-crystallin family)